MTKPDIDRLLFAKRLLNDAGASSAPEPDAYFVAKQVITSHDAAEMAIAAIASAKRAVPGKNKAYLLDYLLEVQRQLHPNRAIEGYSFFVALNDAIALALHHLFEENRALSGFTVGHSKTEDALKLTGFGVHANDFLSLQELVPRVASNKHAESVANWIQTPYGHPGNWTDRTLDFCIKTVVDIAIKIQDAAWIPGAVDLHTVYNYKITAPGCDVEVWDARPDQVDPNALQLGYWSGKVEKREVVFTIKANTSIICDSFKVENVFRPRSGRRPSLRDMLPTKYIRLPIAVDLFGWVELNEVVVSCVPREDAWIKEYIGDLEEIPWDARFA